MSAVWGSTPCGRTRDGCRRSRRRWRCSSRRRSRCDLLRVVHCHAAQGARPVRDVVVVVKPEALQPLRRQP
jgi:hypothetical protein